MPLDDEYFTWLYSQVGSVDNKNLTQTYWKLLRLLYGTEFFWTIGMDENRAHDGKDLRMEFLRGKGVNPGRREKSWLEEACSVLELIYALAWKVAFEGGGEPHERFWELIGNLGLAECTDADPPDPRIVGIILEKWMAREYAPNGAGGLFPLQDADTDQRQVELWYQAQAYLLEQL